MIYIVLKDKRFVKKIFFGLIKTKAKLPKKFIKYKKE